MFNLVSIGMEQRSAIRVAEDLCGSEQQTTAVNPTERAGIVEAILHWSARARGMALIIEDLHKASPSLLALVSGLISRFTASGQSRVILFASTRPFYAGSSSLRSEWLSALGGISHAETSLVFDLDPPSPREAAQLLCSSIGGLEGHQANTLIDVVGTSPFLLREALLYLLATDCLENDAD